MHDTLLGRRRATPSPVQGNCLGRPADPVAFVHEAFAHRYVEMCLVNSSAGGRTHNFCSTIIPWDPLIVLASDHYMTTIYDHHIMTTIIYDHYMIFIVLRLYLKVAQL